MVIISFFQQLLLILLTSQLQQIQLGKRNLYPNLASFKTRKQSSDDRIDNRNQLRIIQNILSYADGQHFLIDIATKLNINLSLIKKVNHILKKNK